MKRTRTILGPLVAALLVCSSLPAVRAFAKHHMGMPEMIAGAKTAADHNKLAAQ